jgi:hypothetical protein
MLPSAILPARSDQDLVHVRALFLEYAASLPFDLSFQSFERTGHEHFNPANECQRRPGSE